MTPGGRTLVTELGTALGLLDVDVDRVWFARPPRLLNVADAHWAALRDAVDGDGERFAAAYDNGRHFLLAPDGLRGRPPALVEWRGPMRVPGDEVAPIDLRIDHVFQVSCKYLSKITLNASPSYLFERMATGGQGRRSEDWFARVDAAGYRRLYDAALGCLDDEVRGAYPWPAEPTDLTRPLRDVLREQWKHRRPPAAFAAQWETFSRSVSACSAEAWRANLGEASPESMLWRLLRIGSAPYFVLGLERRDAGFEPLRVRVMTPWDWRHAFELLSFDIEPGGRAQPSVDWRAQVRVRRDGSRADVNGHVEVRWSHGRFNGPPEAKVYLDVPLSRVPGYVEL